MKTRTRILTKLFALMLYAFLPVAAQAKVTLVVQYAYPDVYNAINEQIRVKFNALHPDIEIKFLSSYKDFEDALQGVLRGAITGQMPDVTYQALNRIRALSDRRIAVDLGPFLKADPNRDKLGFSEALLSLGQVQDKQYGLGWAISTPIIYYNADLVKKAGGDVGNPPKTWDELFALAAKIDNRDEKVTGLKIEWDTTGNWIWQALVNSYGGTMLTPDEKKVAFDGEAGKAAIETLDRAITVGKMRDTNLIAGRQDFMSGRLGIWVRSASLYGQVMTTVNNRFPVRTAPFLLSAGDKSRVPAGGTAVMMLTKDPEKQKAAWEYIKFVTGPEAQSILVKATGYLASNDILANDKQAVAGFIKENANYAVSVSQLPSLTAWYAYPGENGLKITDVITDNLQAVVNQSAKPDATLKKMAAEVQALLPK